MLVFMDTACFSTIEHKTRGLVPVKLAARHSAAEAYEELQIL